MFKQLKQSVVSAISSDPLYAYTLDTSSTTLCGRGYLFEKCDAVVRANGRKVSIFTLHTKRLLERCTPDEALTVVKTVKDSVALLTHLRHPGVLAIEGQIVEEKKKVWFVTERVTSVLAPETVKDLPQQVKLLGMTHCAEGIRFLHEKAEILLVNFALSSIYVTEGNRWKVGDLCFAVPRAQLGALTPPTVPFHSVAAPLLDYLPIEYIDFCTRRKSATDNLFAGTSSAPLVFPDSDTYSFLVVTCEVIDERRLFNCGGNAQEQQRQMSAAESRVAQYFPAGALRLPRPPILTVVNTGPFATQDMKTLIGLATFDTLDSDARFRLLKGLYDGLVQGSFCESVLLSDVVPLMVRESKVDAMLRFVLPILLLCTKAISSENFNRALRDYFVSFLTAIIRAPSMENVSVYAEQVLQKREGLDKHFSSVEDRATYLIPLISKLLQSDGNERIQKGTLEWLLDILKQTPTVKLGLPNDIAARLIGVASANTNSFMLAFQCVEQILTFASTETKMEVEASLARSISNSSAYFTSTQLDYMLRVLRSIEENMSSEHRALKSIPLLCPLLLHANGSVKQFAVASIVNYAQAFNAGSPAPLPQSHALFTQPTALVSSSSSVSPPVRSSGPTANGSCGVATSARRNDDDLFSTLFS
ncbi:hypothetical protein ABB37_04917 [Leptomonas pyrrhocoris]|uniref:Protein kinase domain-containing protein n=1 Tax=Leptomonas pyrrhocoris TaxID=157538 RepID=A0A0N1J4S1_LEPPY|nr:hypothetical protein ABB37_04917 [Leptomonas pyrrhocoris]KPA79824.1 hypothetical protein ABB37_04917 [Leptomonas pyrrhocoris]|eukprot:XP_015658263.1 hypothetical protein ABB37_04917 [Leptomonas pyrrhocoris]